MLRAASYARKEVRTVASDPTTPDMPDLGDQAFIRGLLGTGHPLPEGTDLDAPVAGVPERMPDEVWTRLERAIHAEAAHREASAATSADAPTDGNVASFADAAERRRLRSKPSTYFALAAAGALVFGGTIVMQTVQSRTPDPSAVSAAVERGAVEVGSATTQQIGADAPTRRVMATGVDYQPTTMATQIRSTLQSINAADMQTMNALAASGPATVGSNGVTAKSESLRACIDEIVDIPGIQALIVDRASYLGDDAVVIVIPEGLINPSQATSADGDPLVHVYVVSPTCRTDDDLVMESTLEVDH